MRKAQRQTRPPLASFLFAESVVVVEIAYCRSIYITLTHSVQLATSGSAQGLIEGRLWNAACGGQGMLMGHAPFIGTFTVTLTGKYSKVDSY